jgi:hypothetical protein
VLRFRPFLFFISGNPDTFACAVAGGFCDDLTDLQKLYSYAFHPNIIEMKEKL